MRLHMSHRDSELASECGAVVLCSVSGLLYYLSTLSDQENCVDRRFFQPILWARHGRSKESFFHDRGGGEAHGVVRRGTGT
jgi:hypothetical protein